MQNLIGKKEASFPYYSVKLIKLAYNFITNTAVFVWYFETFRPNDLLEVIGICL